MLFVYLFHLDQDTDQSMNSHQSVMLSDEEATLYDRQIRLWGADAQLK
jgi:hypothetical protein